MCEKQLTQRPWRRNLRIGGTGVLLALVAGCASLQRSSGPGVRQILEQTDEYYDPAPDPAEVLPDGPSHPQLREEIRHIQLLWPLKSPRITSAFGRRWGKRHEGIDLQARTGTPVLAALSGIVAYASDRLSGYGNMIIIKHARGVATVYAHNSKLMVKVGDLVRRGRVIALSGRSGSVDGPHLHFEVRDQGESLDPMLFLPAQAGTRR